jgi:hypothetical protein
MITFNIAGQAAEQVHWANEGQQRQVRRAHPAGSVLTAVLCVCTSMCRALCTTSCSYLCHSGTFLNCQQHAERCCRKCRAALRGCAMLSRLCRASPLASCPACGGGIAEQLLHAALLLAVPKDTGQAACLHDSTAIGGTTRAACCQALLSTGGQCGGPCIAVQQAAQKGCTAVAQACATLSSMKNLISAFAMNMSALVLHLLM